MFFNARSDLFRFQLPKVFFPTEVTNRYLPYIKRVQHPVETAHELCNFSIQSVTIPNFNYSPVDQVKPGRSPDGQARGTVKKWRAGLNQELLIDRSFSVNFKMFDGFVNYWIMNEIFFYYYDFANTKPFTVDIPIRILDHEGNLMYSVIFEDCLYTSIGEFTLDFTENDIDNKSFTCDFEFNNIRTGFEVG